MYYIFSVFGLIIGSFLNVCAIRIPKGETIMWGRSHCSSCLRDLKWWHLLPLVSYIILGGKCAYCGSKISWRYPLIEVVTGVLYVLLWNHFGLTKEFALGIFLCSLLLVISLIDYDLQLIPNKLVVFGLVLGIPLALWTGILSPMAMLLGSITGGGILLLVVVLSRGGMGMGDVKLMAMLGAYLGWQQALQAVFIASLMGAGVGLIMMASKNANGKTSLPFGPFLAGGAMIMFIWGGQVVNWYWGLFS